VSMKQKLIDTLDHKLAFDRATAEAIVDAILERMSQTDVIEVMAKAHYHWDGVTRYSPTRSMVAAVEALKR